MKCPARDLKRQPQRLEARTLTATPPSPLQGNNIGHYDRMLHTNNSKIVVLEGPIRMDICQKERLIVNGVGVKIKFTQMDDSFRLIAGDSNNTYQLEIIDFILKVCQVKLNPKILVAQNEILNTRKTLYPIWQFDLKTYNIQEGDYERKKEDLYHGSVPNTIVLALCSSEAYNGNYTKTLLIFITTT